ncbi:MAG: hypothetical protein JNK78_00545 [Planctomycetes bacterium]|nr:hypothetical protein [Planctomycetota bacterium]
MRLLSSFVLLAALFAGCASQPAACEACKNAQSVIDGVAKQNPDCTRLTLHCSMEGGAKCCASTAADRVGKASDKEDVEAMSSGKTVVLDEAGAVDVTVPIRAMNGKFMSSCGVTLKGMPRDQAVAKAATIAKSVEDGLKGCGDCCCAGESCCSK